MGIWFKKVSNNSIQKPPPFLTQSINVGRNALIGLTGVADKHAFLCRHGEGNKAVYLAVDGEIDSLASVDAQTRVTGDDFCLSLINAYRQKGADAFASLNGPVTLVLYDAAQERVVLYRSPLHGFPLYYVQDADGITVSTTPLTLGQKPEINTAAVAALFTLDPRRFSGSYFNNVHLLPQGEIFIHTSKSTKNIPVPFKFFSNEKLPTDDTTVFQRYKTLFEQSVEKSLATGKNHAVMLSSGLDSSSLAVMASEALRERPETLTAISWSFTQSEIDESDAVERFCRAVGIPLLAFNADRLGPFDNLERLKVLPETPFLNAFWQLNSMAYETASGAGIERVMNGNYADVLFPSSLGRVKAALRDGRFDLLPSLAKENLPWKRTASLRKPKLPKDSGSPWLTESSHALLTGEAACNANAVSRYHAHYLGWERYLSAPYGVERIEPHKEAALIRFMAALPPYMIYRHGYKKYIVREALKGLLPEETRLRKKVARLQPFALKSFLQNRRSVEAFIFDCRHHWEPYVDAQWMRRTLRDAERAGATELSVIWQCITLGRWMEALQRHAPGGNVDTTLFHGL